MFLCVWLVPFFEFLKPFIHSNHVLLDISTSPSQLIEQGLKVDAIFLVAQTGTLLITLLNVNAPYFDFSFTHKQIDLLL